MEEQVFKDWRSAVADVIQPESNMNQITTAILLQPWQHLFSHPATDTTRLQNTELWFTL